MVIALKILLGLIGLLLLYLAVNWLFAPSKVMKQHDIQASSSTGRNYLRGDIGGILLGGGIMIFMFLYQGGERWLLPGIILISAVVLGRVLSLMMDGHSKMGVQAIVIEMVIIGLMVGIHYLS